MTGLLCWRDSHPLEWQLASLQGLLGLSIIHFARWAIIKRNQWPDLGQGKQKLRNDYNFGVTA